MKESHVGHERKGSANAREQTIRHPADACSPEGGRLLKLAALMVLVCCLTLSSMAGGPLQAAPAEPDATNVLVGVGLSLSPQPAVIQGCETIPVEVRVNDVIDLYGVDVKLTFDPNVLEVVDANPAKLGVQVQDGSFLSADFFVSREADNVGGSLEYVMTQTDPSLPVSGSGVLFTILFRARSTATSSALTFTQTDLVDIDGTLMVVTAVNGSASTIAPAGPALDISRLNPTDVRLSWSEASGVLNYQLHRKTAPYFVPAAPPYKVTADLSYDDLGALGDPAENYYYVVQSVCASGFSSQPSNRMGEFDFALVPGS